jgi:hypothetical protein
MEVPTFLYDRSYIYHLNSGDRIEGTNGNFQTRIDFPNNKITDFDTIALLDASIPKSYYSIQTGQNTFTLEENGTDITITISPGTYSATVFATALATGLTVGSQTAVNYSVTFDLNTAKFKFEADTNSITIKLKFNNFMYNRLGFDKGGTYTFEVEGNKSILNSVNVIDMSPEVDIMLRTSLVQGIDANEDILYDISTAGVPPYGIVKLLNNDPVSHSRDLNTATNLFTFRLTDENDNDIILNGINFTATLLFYKKSSLPQKIKDFIRYIVELF